jgi:hypothetical protein
MLATLTALRDVLVAVLTADKGFVHFNDAAHLVHVHLDKGNTDAMAHIPSGLVGAEAHRPHDLHGANALLAGQHRMGDAIPVTQGLVGVLENGASNAGEAVAVRRTGAALPMKALIRGVCATCCCRT